jgi:hypothetical protein
VDPEPPLIYRLISVVLVAISFSDDSAFSKQTLATYRSFLGRGVTRRVTSLSSGIRHARASLPLSSNIMLFKYPSCTMTQARISIRLKPYAY